MTTETPPRTYYDGNGRYDKARAQVEETQGNIWTERNWWRVTTLLLMLVVAILGGGLIALARQPKHLPVYLKVNHDGQLQVLQWDAYQPTEAEIKADLLTWMRCARGIPLDRTVLERCWRLVPMFLLERTQARSAVKARFDAIQPGKALFQKSIDVHSMKAWRHPDGRWQVAFTEDVYEMPKGGGLGRLLSSTPIQAILIVTRQEPTKREHIELDGEPINPRGLFITHLSWE